MEPMTGTSLLTSELTTLVSQFGLDAKATVIALFVLLVPIGLGIWGMSFGVKKGIGFLQKKAAKAL